MDHDKQSSSSGRVLVVDDERAVCQTVATVLAQHGYCVRHAMTLADALSAIALGVKPDLIVTDLVMPDAGGLELLRRVRESWPDIPVLLMTGYPSAGTAVQGMQLGAAGYLPKPFTPDELAAAVAATVLPRTAVGTEPDELVFKVD